MPSITVLDANTSPVTIQTLPAVGTALKVAALPTTVATDDVVSTGIAALAAAVATNATAALQTTGNSAIGTTNSLITTGNASLVTIAASTNQALATGGATPFSAVLAASTNATNVKASAGQVYSITVSNNAATIGYLKLYNSASAPTAGAGTPVQRIQIPASATVNVTFPLGLAFSSGIGFTVTGGITDVDTTAIAATMLVNIAYK